MVLDLGGQGMKNLLFPFSRDRDQGYSQKRIRIETLVVAKDGTGDFEDIQSAIDNLPSGGGDIFIKEGIYEIDATININRNNILISGAGIATVIKRSSDLAINLIKLGNGSTTRSHIILEKFAIDDVTGGSASMGIVVDKCDRVWIKDCYLKNTHDYAIQVESDSNYVWIINNYISTAGGLSLNVLGDYCFVENNYITEADLDIRGNFNVCKGNIIKTTGGDDLNIYGDHVVVLGNILTSVSDDGIRLTNTSSNCTVVGNIIDDTDGITDQGAGNVVAHNFIKT
jgi:hypothetical protein